MRGRGGGFVDGGADAALLLLVILEAFASSRAEARYSSFPPSNWGRSGGCRECCRCCWGFNGGRSGGGSGEGGGGEAGR